MILVKNNSKIGHIEGIWPIYYRTTSQILHGGTIGPNKNAIKTSTTANQQIYHCHFLPVPTVIVQTLTALMQTIFQSLNGWEKTRPSDGYTARLVVLASVNGKVHLCSIPNYPKSMSYALSNVSATAVLSKVSTRRKGYLSS